MTRDGPRNYANLGQARTQFNSSYAAFVRNERFKQTIDLLDEPTQPELTVVK